MQPVLPRVPLWARWVISLSVAAALLLALVLFVEHNSNGSEATQSPAALARANREAEIVVARDQRPHVVMLRRGTGARAGLVKAIRAEMTAMINSGTIEGGLTRATCTEIARHGQRLAFRCTAVAAGVNYPFLAVVDLRARHLTYCKRDQPPVPAMNITVSGRCRA